MNLTSSAHAFQPEGFRVWAYRSVRDSGFVPLTRLTALVGRERSGKTTLLQALRGLDPRARSPYSAERDWPRGRKPQPNGDHVVCALHLRLGPDLRDRWVNENRLHPEAVGVRVGRTYDNRFHVTALEDLVLRGTSQRLASWEHEDESLRETVLEYLPALLFSSSTSLLPERIPLDDLAGSIDAHWEGDGDEAEDLGVRALGQLLGIGPLGDPKNEVIAMLNELPARVVKLNAQLEAFGFAHEVAVVEEHGQLRVLTRRGRIMRPVGGLIPSRRLRFTLNLRATAALTRSQSAPVFLLDAPGKAFKGGLKRQLRPTLSAYADAGIPVVYTSRMPFHIELQHPEQVLVLGAPQVEVDRLCGRATSDSDLTPQAALGMQGRSSFRIDDVNLVVEGPTDAGILRALMQLMEHAGEDVLPADLNIVSAGGAFEVAAVARFLSRQGLAAVGLFDSDAAGRAGQGQLESAAANEASLRGPVGWLLLGSAAGIRRKHATIEDLFPDSLYLDAFECVADSQAIQLLHELDAHAPLTEEEHLPRWLKATFESKHVRFPKVEISGELERRVLQSESIDELPGSLAVRVRSLFGAIRAELDACVAGAGPGESSGSSEQSRLRD